MRLLTFVVWGPMSHDQMYVSCWTLGRTPQGFTPGSWGLGPNPERWGAAGQPLQSPPGLGQQQLLALA